MLSSNALHPQESNLPKSILSLKQPTIKHHKLHQLDITPKKLNVQFLKRLHANSWKLTQEGFMLHNDDLVKVIKTGNSIQELHLEPLSYNRYIQKNKRGLCLLRQIFQGLDSLQVLDIKFFNASLMTNTDLYHIGRALRKVYGLKTVILHLFDCPEVTDKGLFEISQSLRRMNSLKLKDDELPLEW